MIIEIFVFVVVSNVAVQAVPLINLEPTSTQVPCYKKMSWYRQIIGQTDRLYNEYAANLGQLSLYRDSIQTLKEEHVAFENIVSEVFNGPKDDSKEEIDCYAAIDWYQTMNTNLAKIAMDIERELLDVLNRSEVSPRRKNLITYLVAKLVNFLSTVNLPTNQFKDLKTLEKQSQMDQEDKLLESAHKAEQGSYEVNPKFDEKEVDAVFQLVYENPTTHQPMGSSEYDTENYINDDTTTDTYIYPPEHETIRPVSYTDLPGRVIAVGCGLLIVIVFAVVAVLCPCKRTTYNQF